MSESLNYDAIFIGDGLGTWPLSQAFAKSGKTKRIAIVEKRTYGGTCINDGCMPTKTMVSSAKVAHQSRRGLEYGILTGKIQTDMKKVNQRKNELINRLRGNHKKVIDSHANIDFYLGSGRFIDTKSVEVTLNDGGTLQISADTIFINTGLRPRYPEIDGLHDVPILNNTALLDIDILPDHLLILGGGYIGLEFGQMFRRFGSQVTIIQRNSQLLPKEDTDVSDEILTIMREDGIRIYLGSNTKKVTLIENNMIQLTVTTDNGNQNIIGSHLLVATGRIPNSDHLNLEAANIESDIRGFIKVNSHLETSTPGIYALGDVKGGPAFKHISNDDARILQDNLLHHGERSTENRFVPYVVFIDPQLGRVGLNQKEADTMGLSYRVAKLPMSKVIRADNMGETRGFMKCLVDAETDLILGASILGVEGGEIMTVLQMAMMGNLPYTTVRDATIAHPTLAESLNRLFEQGFD